MTVYNGDGERITGTSGSGARPDDLSVIPLSPGLNEMGFSADWIERQLAHIEPNAVRRTYNHAEYLSDRAEMMQKWADMLDAWKKAALATSNAAAQ